VKTLKQKTSASQSKTDASKQNEKPTLNKSFYASINHPAFENVAGMNFRLCLNWKLLTEQE
jgi:hypothetical protein